MFRRGIVACDECTKNCITIHHLDQRGPSSTVSRFFKIMHGRNYSEVLYLPPKFARDVRHLVGQKTRIEDSNGHKWTVEFSLVDGALAFQEGWHKFVEDHQLEHGEILVFNYVKHGHFVVQIYGLSACEIMDLNRRRKLPKKRSRSDQETVEQDESHQIRNKRFTLTSKNMEDPSCILSRDYGKYEVDNREFLFDLSNFEMGKNSSVAEKSETSLHRNITAVDTQIREQIKVMRIDNQMSLPPTDQKNNHLCGIVTDAFQTELSGNSNSSKDMPDDVSKFQASETENNRLHAISSDALQTKPPGNSYSSEWKAKLSGNSNSSKDMPDDVSKFQASQTENNSLHAISSDALQTKPPGNSYSSEGMQDDISKSQAGEMENKHLCAIYTDALQKKHSGNSDSRKAMPDAIKFRTGGTNNYQSCDMFSESFLAKPSSNSDSGKDMFDEVFKFQACETSVAPPFVARDMKSPYICSSLLAESSYSTNSKHCDTSVTSSMHKDPFAATFKKEVVKSGEELYGFRRIFGEDEKKSSTLGTKCGPISSSIIKTEPDMDNVLDPAGASTHFSAEVKSLAFLELPLCMPSIQGRRERGHGKVVYLKDSTTRLWPVLYPGKSFAIAFTDGWRTFCKGNSIRTGDVCRFQVEKYMMPSCIFKVDIIRKAG